ncbi:hypothetical protein HZS_1053 [Henneguya salminicola]|nr:hypothetical protein HZS_1053 [Henneguya salminicola]
MAPSPEGISKMEKGFKTWCEDFNMTLNENKSALLHIKKKDETCKNFVFCDKPIPIIETDQVYKYLGVKMGLCFDTYNDQVNDLMTDSVECLRKIALAEIPPYIKLAMTKIFILPKLDHVYRLKEINKETLHTFDAQIREQIKLFMNLPKTTNSPFFHSPTSKGGLGIRQFETDGDFCAVRRFLLCLNDQSLLKLIKSRKGVGEEAKTDLSNAELLNLPQLSHRHLGHLSKAIERVKTIGVEFVKENNLTLLKLPNDIDSDIVSPTIEWYKIRNFLGEKSFKKFKKMRLQEATASCCALDPNSNVFINKGNLPINSYSWLFLTRLDLLPTKASLKTREIINPGGENYLKCKLCGLEEETLSHILNGCSVNKHLQTKRHDAIIKKLVSNSNLPKTSVLRLNKKYPFDGKSRPDIIIINNNKSELNDYLLEISVAFDHQNNYTNSYNYKEEKYKNLSVIHKEKTDRDLIIIPIIFGSLGSTPSNAKAIAEVLNIDPRKMKNLLQRISVNTVMNSKSIYDQYMAG